MCVSGGIWHNLYLIIINILLILHNGRIYMPYLTNEGIILKDVDLRFPRGIILFLVKQDSIINNISHCKQHLVLQRSNHNQNQNQVGIVVHWGNQGSSGI